MHAAARNRVIIIIRTVLARSALVRIALKIDNVRHPATSPRGCARWWSDTTTSRLGLGRHGGASTELSLTDGGDIGIVCHLLERFAHLGEAHVVIVVVRIGPRSLDALDLADQERVGVEVGLGNVLFGLARKVGRELPETVDIPPCTHPQDISHIVRPIHEPLPVDLGVGTRSCPHAACSAGSYR